MTAEQKKNNFPRLHNAMWPGLVGKGSPGAEPCIDLDTMLDLTAKAEVNGVRFDGVDIFLFEPHINIDADNDGIQRMAEKVQARGFEVGSVVAPVWPPTGGGSAMGSAEDTKKFVGQVRKACRIARRLRELGVRPYGVVRIDSASGVNDWLAAPEENQQRIAETFREAAAVAAGYGERLAAEGEICWGGMHSWKKMVNLLERVNSPETLGFQADMAHTLLYVLGYNEPEDAILPSDWDWSDPNRFDKALATLTRALRPWTIDFHVAQNDATVHGSGTHDKTGHHCLPNDPNGKLSIAHHAGFWLRDDRGQPTRAFRHICWDGCMFSNETMMDPQTWKDILQAMVTVREAHGWREEMPAKPSSSPAVIRSKAPKRAKAKKAAKAAKKPKAKKPAKPVKRQTGKKLRPVSRRVSASTTMKKPTKAKAAKKPAKKAAKKGKK